MKKIGIVTLYGNYNFGNKLQNYALSTAIEQMGNHAETIVAVDRPWLFCLKNKLKMVIPACLCNGGLNTKKINSFLKQKPFIIFNNRYITTKYLKTKKLSRFAKKYNKVVVGSDQVWNPTFGGFESQAYIFFLKFVPKEKRVCVAPSFGISKIPPNWVPMIKDGVEGFDNLSVREKSGADIIYNLTGREATILTDPTLLLNKNEWRTIEHTVEGIPQRYILECFFGHYPSDSNDDQIPVINAFDNQYGWMGPSEFLYLIDHCNYVKTDSFHASVFSIIFGKPFRVYRRNDSKEDMYSRIDTLLALFGENDTQEDRMIYINETKANDIIGQQRSLFRDYLNKVIE